METAVIKDAVKEGYGKIAKHSGSGFMSKMFSCCDREETVKEVSRKIGYSEAEQQSVPEGANLGVGCGNPLSLAKIKKGDTIVDLGSGAGFDCFLASPLVGEKGKVIGVDMTQEMLKSARKNAKRGNYHNVEFVQGDIESLPIEANVADLIISNCVINLSPQKEKVFKEAYRVLKPNGEFSISDIVLLNDLPDFIKNSTAGYMACVAGAEKIDKYVQYAEQAGFKNVKIETKTKFPLELILTDPVAQQIVKEFNMTEKQIKDISDSVISISLSAKK